MKKIPLIDIVRAFAGTEENVVSAVLAKHGLVDGRPIVVGLEAQRDALGASLESVDFHVAPEGYEPEVLRFVADVVREHLNREDFGAGFVIYSFHPMIFNRQGELAPLAWALDVSSPRDLLRQSSTFKGDAWPVQLMPLEEALQVLREALQREGAAVNPVSKTNIRDLLKRRDSRFDGRVNPAARTDHLISTLLTGAERQGWVRLLGQPPRVYVQLIDGFEHGELSTVQYSDATNQIESTGSDAMHRAPRSGIIGTAGDPSGAQVEFVPITKSQVFQDVLRKGRLGPHADVRELLWDSLEESLKDEPVVRSVSYAMRRAIDLTRDRSPDSFSRSKEDLPKDSYPWRNLEGFAVSVCARAGLIEDGDGQIISSGSPWKFRQGCFIALPDDWRERVDAELVLEIIRRCNDVGWDDRPNLAGALYLDRGDEFVNRVDRSIEILFARGAIDQDAETGFLVEKD